MRPKSIGYVHYRTFSDWIYRTLANGGIGKLTSLWKPATFRFILTGDTRYCPSPIAQRLTSTTIIQ